MSGRSWTTTLLSRLQNIFALTVWPQNSSKKLTFGDSGEDDDDDVLLFGNMPKASGAAAAAAAAAGKGGRKFLDRYSDADIRGLLETFRVREGPHAGQTFVEVLASVGIPMERLLLDIDVSDGFVHRLQAYCGAPMDSAHLCVQLFIRRETTFSVLHTKTFDPARSGVPRFYADAFGEGLAFMRGYFAPAGGGAAQAEQLLSMICIEWLRFQNPQREWGATVPLPGQLHPGLGIVFEMHQLLGELCKLRHRDGILDIPEHWYNAYLYAKMPQPYRFLNPAFEGFFQATRMMLEPVVKQRGLAAVAWAVLKGQLFCTAGDGGNGEGNSREWIRWVGQEQVSPITPRLNAYFESAGYRAIAAKYNRPDLFGVDFEQLHSPLDFPHSRTFSPASAPMPTSGPDVVVSLSSSLSALPSSLSASPAHATFRRSSIGVDPRAPTPPSSATAVAAGSSSSPPPQQL